MTTLSNPSCKHLFANGFKHVMGSLLMVLISVFMLSAESTTAFQGTPGEQDPKSETTGKTSTYDQRGENVSLDPGFSALESVAPRLSTPREALQTFFYWQYNGQRRFDLASATMKLAPSSSQEDKMELARKLLMVLNARGYQPDPSIVPNDPDWKDEMSGNARYILTQRLPVVTLVRSGSDWVFSQETIASIPDLYESTYSEVTQRMLNRLPDTLRFSLFGIEVWQFIALLIWILIGFILMKVFDHVLDKYLRPLTMKTSSRWDDKLYDQVERPLEYIFLFIWFRLTYANLMLPVKVNNVLSTGFEIAISVSIVWLLYRLSDIAAMYLEEVTSKTDSKLDDQLVPILRKSLKVFVISIGSLFILQNNGINVTSLLAGLGLGGLAFALAARDTLANFFGSITIFVDKPFQIGDWIKVGSLEGTVEEVGFRSTRIRTFYNSLITVPNAKLADAEVDNLGLREYRRFKTTLNLTYTTTPEEMEAFVEGIKAVIRSTPAIRQDTYEIHFESFGASSLDVLVYIFFKVPSWSDEMQARHNFLLDILRLSKEVGVDFAFPTHTVHIGSHHQGEENVRPAKSPNDLGAVVESFAPEGTNVRPGGIRIYRDGREIDFSAVKG